MIEWDEEREFVLFCFVVIFRRGGHHCLSQHRRDGFSLITMGVGKPERLPPLQNDNYSKCVRGTD